MVYTLHNMLNVYTPPSTRLKEVCCLPPILLTLVRIYRNRSPTDNMR